MRLRRTALALLLSASLLAGCSGGDDKQGSAWAHARYFDDGGAFDTIYARIKR